MRFVNQVGMSTMAAGLLLTPIAAAPEPQKPVPFTVPLDCASGDCALLKGVPQTAGMRSGFVRLKPGATVGWHTTGQHEESLIILHGQGEALIDGQEKKAFVAPAFVYIAPSTRHNVLNTGKDQLEYVYVVAPVSK
jgi:quercetin dioxygenase-like cupin family protein